MKLRTDGWYGRTLEGFGYRSWMKRCLPDDAFTDGKPHIFPTTSRGETQLRPTEKLLHNFLAMDVEASLRGNAVDGVAGPGSSDSH